MGLSIVVIVDLPCRSLAAERVPVKVPLGAPGQLREGKERRSPSNGSPNRKASARFYPLDERADQGFEALPTRLWLFRRRRLLVVEPVMEFL